MPFYNVRIGNERVVSYNHLTRALIGARSIQRRVEGALVSLHRELYGDEPDSALSALERIKDDYQVSYAAVVETAVARYAQ